MMKRNAFGTDFHTPELSQSTDAKPPKINEVYLAFSIASVFERLYIF